MTTTSNRKRYALCNRTQFIRRSELPQKRMLTFLLVHILLFAKQYSNSAPRPLSESYNCSSSGFLPILINTLFKRPFSMLKECRDLRKIVWCSSVTGTLLIVSGTYTSSGEPGHTNPEVKRVESYTAKPSWMRLNRSSPPLSFRMHSSGNSPGTSKLRYELLLCSATNIFFLYDIVRATSYKR